MRLLVALLFLALLAPASATPTVARAGADPMRAMPTYELPLKVTTSLSIYKTIRVDDRAGRLEVICDLRLTWLDPRLAFDPMAEGSEHRNLVSDAAREMLESIWVPRVKFENLADPLKIDDAVLDQGLNIKYDGTIRWSRRLRAQFGEIFNVETFPLDRQTLKLSLYSPYESKSRLLLVQDEEARASTRHGDEPVAGWKLGRMWAVPSYAVRANGAAYSQLTFQMRATRLVAPYVSSIFVPLTAVMLIPLLASILNVWEGKGFRYEAWQMANVNLSGLVATVALTLTIYNSYPFLNGTDNVVARLLALDYMLVGLAMLIVMTLFRWRVGEKPFASAHVVGELYACLSWALPAIMLSGVATIIATALM